MRSVNKNIVAALMLLSSCVVRPNVTPQMPSVQKVELRALPADPATMPIPKDILAEGNWVVPLEAGACVPTVPLPATTVQKPCPSQSGIFESEAHAVKDQQYRISYDELRKLYEADRTVWDAQRNLYEETIQNSANQLAKMQPTWFTQNEFSLGVLGGFLLGSLSVSAIVVLTK